MLETMKKSFPLDEDFFRNVMAFRVLNAGFEIILKHLEERSTKVVLTKEDLDTLHEIEQLIRKSRIGESLQKAESLLGRLQGNSIKKDLIAITGRWNSLRQQVIDGTIDNKEISTRENEIRKALLFFLDEVKGFI